MKNIQCYIPSLGNFDDFLFLHIRLCLLSTAILVHSVNNANIRECQAIPKRKKILSICIEVINSFEIFFDTPLIASKKPNTGIQFMHFVATYTLIQRCFIVEKKVQGI